MRRLVSALVAGAMAGAMIPAVVSAAPPGNTYGTLACSNGHSYSINFADVGGSSGSEAFVVGDHAVLIGKSITIYQPGGSIWYQAIRGLNGFSSADLVTCSGTPDGWAPGWSATIIGFLTPRG